MGALVSVVATTTSTTNGAAAGHHPIIAGRPFRGRGADDGRGAEKTLRGRPRNCRLKYAAVRTRNLDRFDCQ